MVQTLGGEFGACVGQLFQQIFWVKLQQSPHQWGSDATVDWRQGGRLIVWLKGSLLESDGLHWFGLGV